MPTAVVLGAYGLIGSACLRALRAAGFDVTGVGRSLAAGHRVDPEITWVAADIASTSTERWREVLAGADVVVNASGALQDSSRDNLTGIHERAISRLTEALGERSTRFVQISAAGVSEQASTEFFRSKARGDNVLRRSPLPWFILRPTLVISSQAYGGTSMLRAAAALPVGVRLFEDVPVQTVSVEDVAQAVVRCARGDIAPRQVFDLTEAGRRTFAETVAAVRRWQGFPAWRHRVPLPAPFASALGRGADVLGWLGWRSPLRTAALSTLGDGITGDPQGWEAAGGHRCRSLEATLAQMPSTVQERWFARLYLLFPLAVASLAIFWMLSGLVGLLQLDAARAVLEARGVATRLATLAVIGGSVVDLALGCAVLYRPWARRACVGMILVAAGYLAGATVMASDLWADPLGPLVKVLPSITLALVTCTLLEDR